MIKLLITLALMALGPAIIQGLFCLGADIRSRDLTRKTALITITVVLMIYAVYVIYGRIEVI